MESLSQDGARISQGTLYTILIALICSQVKVSVSSSTKIQEKKNIMNIT